MTRVAVEFTWQPAGTIRLEGSRPAFPALPETPGLYRFTFAFANGPTKVYIGETDNLRRRAQQYRTPGPSQATNLRMNNELTVALSRGTAVSVATITDATIELDNGMNESVDLSRKTGRLMLENLAMAAVIAGRDADPAMGAILVNRPGVGEGEWQ